MPAHMCIYKRMFYIYLMKYLFNISECKAMLIKLLIYHINIYFIHMCMYVLGMGHDFRIFYLIVEYRLGCAIIF